MKSRFECLQKVFDPPSGGYSGFQVRVETSLTIA